MDDIVVNKAAVIERCIRRAREEYAAAGGDLATDITRQDSIVLNVQRGCEAAIDLAMHLVRTARAGVPQESRDAFDLLVATGRLDKGLAEKLKKMVGFRNVAVHDYQDIDLAILSAIVREHLDDLRAFSEHALRTQA
jgi:uncharacterized protein YutE (UPF0331/DUF86 family)